LTEANTPYPMIPTAISTTTPATAIGPQLRLPLTLTGAVGLRPLPPLPGAPPGREPGRAPADLAPVDLAAGGLPWPDVLSTFTVDGTRSGPGLLMLIVPRQSDGKVGPGPRAGPGTPPGGKVYPDSMAQ
jgi:hypothetical protein